MKLDLVGVLKNKEQLTVLPVHGIELGDDDLKVVQGGYGQDNNPCYDPCSSGGSSNYNYNASSNQGSYNYQNTTFYTRKTTYYTNWSSNDNSGSDCQSSSGNVIVLVIPGASSNCS